MSLSIDGVWKAGVWATTVWADGVWYEGPPTVTATTKGGGPSEAIDWKRLQRLRMQQSYMRTKKKHSLSYWQNLLGEDNEMA